jgi:hypothetical protein
VRRERQEGARGRPEGGRRWSHDENQSFLPCPWPTPSSSSSPPSASPASPSSPPAPSPSTTTCCAPASASASYSTANTTASASDAAAAAACSCSRSSPPPCPSPCRRELAFLPSAFCFDFPGDVEEILSRALVRAICGQVPHARADVAAPSLGEHARCVLPTQCC